MDYSEIPVPASLTPFVAAIWTLEAGGEAGERLHHDAVPDGCIEVIRRHSGESSWNGAQPELFVAGLCTAPARLTMSGDARFTGIRLWPWTWNLLGGVPCPEFHNRWIAAMPGSPTEELLVSGEDVLSNIRTVFERFTPSEIGRNVPLCKSPGQLAERCNLIPRTIQRWFQREVGLAPRQYFRLLRFQHSVASETQAAQGIAERAAIAGYSDQSHMTRDFRRFAKDTPRRFARGASGPFLKRRGN